MNILILVNWEVHHLRYDCDEYQPPNKLVLDKKYWFFRYFPESDKVDVIDNTSNALVGFIEKRILKFYIWQAIKGFIRSSKYDLIISHGAQSSLVLSLLRCLFRRNNPPHIVIDVGCFNGGRENKLELFLLSMIMAPVTSLIYHSRIQEQYYKDHFPYIKRSFVPFGADTDFFSPLGLSEQDYIISFGAIKRDYETLLKAWNKVANKGKCRLLIVGSKVFKRSGAMCKDVDFMEFVPIKKLKVLIESARAVVIPLFPFKYANGQKSLLEAMALKKVIFVSNVPGISDYVDDGKNAILVYPQDVDDLVNKLSNFFNGLVNTNMIKEEAFKNVRYKYSEEIMAQKIYEAIKCFYNPDENSSH
jgi:glycosyltransferase involved in cell wall biosynthesis